MSAPPFMQLWVAEWTADVQGLTCEQDGAYWRLIRAMWRAGGALPDAPEKLALICGLTTDRWVEISPEVVAFFSRSKARIYHTRLTAELSKAEAKSKARKVAGKAGGEKKASNNNDKTPSNSQEFATAKPYHSLELESELERIAPTAIAAVPQPNAASGSRLPSGWTPDPESLSTENPELAEAEIAKFRDYWSAVAGAKGRKADWQATWRNWLRRAAENHQPRKAYERPHHDAKHAARQENHARAFAAADWAAGLREEP